MKTETLIVGAGMTGLALGDALRRAGREFLIAESRDRIGGRAFSPLRGGLRHDLGPAWFWPGQPLMAALAESAGLPVFRQFAEGKLIFEDASGVVRRDLTMAPMAGSLRIAGGVGALAEALAAPFLDRILPERRLTGLETSRAGVEARFASPGGNERITARRVVLAMPPRLIAAQLRLSPEPEPMRRYAAVPTWMAGHAKLIAVFDRPFWREAGLSGDAISHRGPLAEIHDASPANAARGALFGFVGVPPAGRRDEETLIGAAKRQLIHLFGEDAPMPREVFLKDWARDPATATGADAAGPAAHPDYGPLPQPGGAWRDRLFIASAETAPVHGGYLEGALVAAATLAERLTA